MIAIRLFWSRQTNNLVIYLCFSDMSRRVAKESFSPTKKEIAVNNGHMAALQTKHAELDSKIETENNRPHPDDALIHSLKKQKLHIKDILMQEAAPA
jgi:uncharacterized protein